MFFSRQTYVRHINETDKWPLRTLNGQNGVYGVRFELIPSISAFCIVHYLSSCPAIKSIYVIELRYKSYNFL